MKTSVLLLSSIFFLVACQKEAKITPKASPAATGPAAVASTDTVASRTAAVTAARDTIPANALLRIKLVSAGNVNNYDETMFSFNKTASLTYNFNEDAAYLSGFGAVSLASISGDGIDLAVNKLPFTPGMAISLDINTKSDGAFSLGVDLENKIPANVQVWVRDTYLRDSLNVTKAAYNFSVVKADTNSFGKKRFKLVVKYVQ